MANGGNIVRYFPRGPEVLKKSIAIESIIICLADSILLDFFDNCKRNY